MALARVGARQRLSVLWLALAWVPACSGGSLSALSAEPVEEEPHHDQAPSMARPAEPPGAFEDEAADVCRAVIRRGDEVLLVSASGRERLIDRNSSWDRSTGGVWAVGEHAIVGVPESESFAGPSMASFALVHSSAGILWRGTAMASDYTRAVGFRVLTREGYALLTDERVIDPRGVQHVVPDAAFRSVGASIADGGFVLVERARELAYWDVDADELEMLSVRGIGRGVTSPVHLGGLAGVDAAFVEERAAGELAFTRVSPDEVERVLLAPDVTHRLRELLATPDAVEFDVVWARELDDAVLLVVDHRPAAWVKAHAAPQAFDAWSSLPVASEIRANGHCFVGAPARARSADELIAGLWRVHTDSGELEMGLRFALPAGLQLAFAGIEAGATSSLPLCVGQGRMAVLLSGPSGSAWFFEADDAFEQLTTWGAPAELELGLDSGGGADEDLASTRAVGPFSGIYAQGTLACELRLEDDGVLMIDHAHDLERLLPGDVNAAFLSPSR